MTKFAAIVAVAGTAVAASANSAIDVDQALLANAQTFTGSAITAADFKDYDFSSRNADLYANMETGPTGYVAFPAANGVLGNDTYTSIASDDIVLNEFGFVGGTSSYGLDGINDGLSVQFFDTGANFLGAFNVTLTNLGNFIYNITTTNLTFDIADAGIVQIEALGDDTAQWFLGDNGATIGTNGAPATGPYNFTFRLNGVEVPTPGAAALAGLAGLAAARRRRA